LTLMKVKPNGLILGDHPSKMILHCGIMGRVVEESVVDSFKELFFLAPRHGGVLGEWMYSCTHSLTSALDGGEWSASRPGRFTPRERASGTHWIGGWVGPRAVLDAVVKRKLCSSPFTMIIMCTAYISGVSSVCTDGAVNRGPHQQRPVVQNFILTNLCICNIWNIEVH
jgi:hypothetical protein